MKDRAGNELSTHAAHVRIISFYLCGWYFLLKIQVQNNTADLNISQEESGNIKWPLEICNHKLFLRIKLDRTASSRLPRGCHHFKVILKCCENPVLTRLRYSPPTLLKGY